MVTIDFETEAIVPGSGLAPKPVGVAILLPGDAQGRYYAWGHPTANNSTYDEARRALAAVWDQPLLMHNMKFDLGVAEQHMDLAWPKDAHDTMFMLYLLYPYAKELGLKPSAERLLGMAPEEQSQVFMWLKGNPPAPSEFVTRTNGKELDKRITKTNFGAYISRVPGNIVEPYAIGDVVRTRALAQLLLPGVEDKGMLPAYQRELKIARIGYDMERRGVPVDREKLSRDRTKYYGLIAATEDQIRGMLGSDIDLNKPEELAQGILQKGYARTLPETPTGKLSLAKGALELHVTDRELLRALRYRGALQTVGGTFFDGWLAFSERDGRVHPSWNQVRSGGGSHVLGARTGRFSCSDPNFQNVPTAFDEPLLEGRDLPLMREYIRAPAGMLLVPGDYNGQEMRILAHYAEGKLLEIYRANPHADIHTVIAQMITGLTGMKLDRKHTKAIAFSLIYGSGIPALAAALGVDTATAEAFKNAYFKALPGVAEFMSEVKGRREIRTWGGRIMPLEDPRVVNERLMTFGYKLANYLIQGSAADQGKEAMIRYDDSKVDGELALFVHDELVMFVPEDRVGGEVPIMRSAMEDMAGWDVPFKVEFEQGRDWHNLKATQ